MNMVKDIKMDMIKFLNKLYENKNWNEMRKKIKT